MKFFNSASAVISLVLLGIILGAFIIWGFRVGTASSIQVSVFAFAVFIAIVAAVWAMKLYLRRIVANAPRLPQSLMARYPEALVVAAWIPRGWEGLVLAIRGTNRGIVPRLPFLVLRIDEEGISFHSAADGTQTFWAPWEVVQQLTSESKPLSMKQAMFLSITRSARIQHYSFRLSSIKAGDGRLDTSELATLKSHTV